MRRIRVAIALSIFTLWGGWAAGASGAEGPRIDVPAPTRSPSPSCSYNVGIVTSMAEWIEVGSAEAATLLWRCTKPNGNPIKNLTACRLQGTFQPEPTDSAAPPATATPSPAPSPTPTPALPCTDGSFVYDKGARILSLGSTARPFKLDPGKLYEFCATVPPEMTAPAGFIETSFVNWSNATCNLYSMWVTSPNGEVTSSLGQVGPKPGMRHKVGKWRVQMWLDPDPNSRCRDRVTGELTNPGFQTDWWAF